MIRHNEYRINPKMVTFTEIHGRVLDVHFPNYKLMLEFRTDAQAEAFARKLAGNEEGNPFAD